MIRPRREGKTRRLAGCALLVLCTRRTDRYHRYVVDLLIRRHEADAGRVLAEGDFLNEELLAVAPSSR